MKTNEERFHEREDKQRADRKNANAARKALARGRMVQPMPASARRDVAHAKVEHRIPSGRVPSKGGITASAKRARRLTETFHRPDVPAESKKAGRGLFVAKVERSRKKARVARHDRRAGR